MAIDVLVKFDIYHDGGSWCARGIGIDIFTHGISLDELNANLREAVEVHYDDELSSGEDITISENTPS